MILTKLESNIKLQQQPDDSSCVPTCIAMALGLPVIVVINEMKQHGLYRDGTGCHEWQVQLYLMIYNIGTSCILNQEGFSLNYGLYLASVNSLNHIKKNHSILVRVYDNEEGRTCVSIYDPNNGREGKEFYGIDDWESCQIQNVTYLNDYSKYSHLIKEF